MISPILIHQSKWTYCRQQVKSYRSQPFSSSSSTHYQPQYHHHQRETAKETTDQWKLRREFSKSYVCDSALVINHNLLMTIRKIGQTWVSNIDVSVFCKKKKKKKKKKHKLKNMPCDYDRVSLQVVMWLKKKKNNRKTNNKQTNKKTEQTDLICLSHCLDMLRNEVVGHSLLVNVGSYQVYHQQNWEKKT